MIVLNRAFYKKHNMPQNMFTEDNRQQTKLISPFVERIVSSRLKIESDIVAFNRDVSLMVVRFYIALIDVIALYGEKNLRAFIKNDSLDLSSVSYEQSDYRHQRVYLRKADLSILWRFTTQKKIAKADITRPNRGT